MRIRDPGWRQIGLGIRDPETERGCVCLKKYESQGKGLKVTVNSKEENS
jgi:hypothetical protein